MNFSRIFFACCGLLLISLAAGSAQEWTITSPAGEIKMVVRLDGEPGAKKLSYRVTHGLGDEVKTMLTDSALGLRLRNQNFVTGLEFVSAKPMRSISENYTLLHGKRRECRNRGNETILNFRNASGAGLEIQFRVYDDGLAFRYRLHGQEDGPAAILEAEATEFAVAPGAKVWCAPSDKPGTYAPAYETYYESEMEPGTSATNGCGWSFPLLFRSAGARHWALITEAGVEPTFCGTRLSNDPTNGVYQIAFPTAAEGNRQGSLYPQSKLPWEMPWRVVVMGGSAADIFESTLVTDVSPPSRVQNTSWIHPGRVAWSWWSDNPSPTDAGKQKKFVDLAAQMGWEYVLVDANWTIIDNGTIHDVLRYAAQKKVGVLLWYNSGGPHNVVTEKPRDCLTYAPVRKFELEMLQKWGVKGVKVDFFQSDKQDVIELYHGMLQDAAASKIMVNFHGCTLPRGWERTYPHLMSMEAVRGEECYIFDSAYPERAPVQNTILPFTRNAVGPMDYTPVGLSNNRYAHKTTWAHELALAVVFESGWLHFTDRAEAYLGLQPEAQQFIKQVPVTWDESRLVDGYPGRFAIVARRHGNTIYVAGINGQNEARTFRIAPGKWLPKGEYEVSTICDGDTARTLKCETALMTPQGFEVKLLAHGGFVAIFKPAR